MAEPLIDAVGRILKAAGCHEGAAALRAIYDRLTGTPDEDQRMERAGRCLQLLVELGRELGGWQALRAVLAELEPPAAAPAPPELVAKLAMLMYDLDLRRYVRVRVGNRLANVNIRYVYELVQKTEREIDNTHIAGFGRKSSDELKLALSKLGLKLGMKFDEATLAAVRAEIARKKAAGK